MEKKWAPVMATPVDDVETPALPALRVQCHCPRDCWANKATLELVDQDGGTPDFYCAKCAPEPMRSSAEFITKHRAELGIPEGVPLVVDVKESSERVRWPHGGNLN